MCTQFREICELARDLNWGNGLAVVTSTVGGRQMDWDSDRQSVADDLLELAELAAASGTVLAVEPHVGNVLDTPEKAVWLMRQTDHPNLKLNFDHSHFLVVGMDLRHCADLCLPFAAHTHIKEGTMADGKVAFLLPGQGTLDMAGFVRTVADARPDLPIVAEVSAQIWRRQDYDPWGTAEFCYRALRDARGEAGV